VERVATGRRVSIACRNLSTTYHGYAAKKAMAKLGFTVLSVK